MGGWWGLPLGGMPSMLSLARARAVCASWGRDVRIREAERGRGRSADSWSSGIGAGEEGVVGSGILLFGWVGSWAG